MKSTVDINMDHGENFEVIKYRPGTFHIPHLDFYYEEEGLEQSTKFGNKYVDGLIFLTGTDLGGNFVMPLLGIAVNPEPGSLVIWSNEDRQGNMDIRYGILARVVALKSVSFLTVMWLACH